MDSTTLIVGLIAAAIIGLVAIILIAGRQRRDAEDRDRVSPYGTSTEGEKRCPACGMGNLWTDKTCVACGGALPG